MHYCPTAHTIWEDMHEQFNKVDNIRIFYFTRDVYHVRQGALTIAQYFAKLKELWDELVVVNDNCLCVDCFICLE